MVGKHKIFNDDDRQRSKALCLSLGLSDSDVYDIDGWFYLFLQKHHCANSAKEGLAYEKELEIRYREIEAGLGFAQHKYILPRLIKYFNILNAGYLRSSYIAGLGVLLENLILEYLNAKRSYYSPAEFVFVIEYLRSNFMVSPNGKLAETILKLDIKDRIVSKSTPEQKLIIVSNILSIIADKGFHHDIICFKKVLALVTKEDGLLIEHIKKYEVRNGQGCYKYVGMVLNTKLDSNAWVDFCLKKELITWLDSAVGAQPKESWINKLTNIKEKVSADKLLLICQDIKEREDLQHYYFDSTAYWGDEVAKRFVKSVKWAESLIYESS